MNRTFGALLIRTDSGIGRNGHVGCGSDSEHLRLSILSLLRPPRADMKVTCRIGRLVPLAEVARLPLMVGERHVHHELTLGRMTGNVPLTRRVLREHDTPGRQSADVAIACLKFNLAG